MWRPSGVLLRKWVLRLIQSRCHHDPPLRHSGEAGGAQATQAGKRAAMNTSDYLCFVDTLRPVTPAQIEGWACYLALPRDHWREARVMFRLVFRGTHPERVLTDFVQTTGLDDPAMKRRLQLALAELSKEARGD